MIRSHWFDSSPRTHHFIKKGGVFTEAVTVASLLTSAGTALTSGMTLCWDMMTANPLLSLFVGASVVTLGFRFFRKAKGVAR